MKVTMKMKVITMVMVHMKFYIMQYKILTTLFSFKTIRSYTSYARTSPWS